MTHVMDRTLAICGFEGAIENGQMFGAESRSTFNGSLFVHEVDDCLYVRIVVAKLAECGRHGVVNDLDRSTTDQLFVLHEREIRLDSGRIAIHHETDRTRRREHCRLRIAV